MRPPGELEPGDGKDAVDPPPDVEPDGIDEGEGEPVDGIPAPDEGEDEPPEGDELPPLDVGEGTDAVEPPPLGLGMPALPVEPLGELGEPALPESFPQPAATSVALTTSATSVGRSQRALRMGVVIVSYLTSPSRPTT